MKKLSCKKIGCLILAVLMMAAMMTGTLAAGATSSVLDPDADVSLTLHKRDITAPMGTDYPINNGLEMDNPHGEGLAGVTFTVYKVADDAESAAIPEHPAENTVFTGTTDENGLLTFATSAHPGFTQGRYLVVESDRPDKVTIPAEPFLVDVPMTNPAGDGWIYGVHIYVKNETYLGSVQLTKTDASTGEKLDGAIFQLERQAEDGSWEVIRENLSATNGILAVDGLIEGDYRFIETQAPAGHSPDTTPVAFTISKANGTAAVAVTMDNDRNMEHPDVTAINKTVTSAEPGRVVEWAFEAYVPTDIAAYQAYSLSDTLEDDRMSFNEASVQVWNNNNLMTADQYAVAFDGQKMTITFTDHTTLTPGSVKVAFSTTNAEDETAVGKFTNTATIHYQAAEEEADSKSDTADTTLYAIDVDKYAAFAQNTKLAGAEFALYLSKEDAKNNTNAFATGVTIDDGSLQKAIAGLNGGTYYLVETKAPEGYKLMSGILTISLDEKLADENYTYVADVANSTVISLPITGGIGTLLFTFGGLALMGAAALLYLRSRKKSAAQA